MRSVRGKLFFVVGLLSCVAIAVGIVGLVKMGAINDQLNQIVDNTSTKQLLAARSRQALLALHRAEKNLVLSQQAEQMDEYAQMIEQYEHQVRDNLDKFLPLANDQNKVLIGEFQDLFAGFLDVNKQVRDNSRRNTNQQAYLLSANQGRELFDQIEAAMFELVQRNDEAVTRLIREVRQATADEGLREKLAEVDDAATRALLGARIRAGMIAMQRAEKNFILARTEEQMKEYAAAMDQLEAEVNDLITRIQETATDENKAVISRFVSLSDQWMQNNDRVRELSMENSNQVAQQLSANQGRELAAQAEAKLQEIVENADQEMLDQAQQSDDQYAAARTLVIVTLVIGVLLGACIAYYIVNGVVKGLNAMVNRLKDIAQGEGDLTQRVDEDRSDELGELGKWFNTFVQRIHDVVAEVASSSHEVASAATEIAASSEEIATGMKE